MSEDENTNVRPYWNASLNIKFYHRGYDCMFTVRPDEDENPMDALRLVADATEYLDSIGASATRVVETRVSTAPGSTTEPQDATVGDVTLPGVTTSPHDMKDVNSGRVLVGRVEPAGSRVNLWSYDERWDFPLLNIPDWQVKKVLETELEPSDLPWDKHSAWVARWELGAERKDGKRYKDLVELLPLDKYREKYLEEGGGPANNEQGELDEFFD